MPTLTPMTTDITVAAVTSLMRERDAAAEVVPDGLLGATPRPKSPSKSRRRSQTK